MKAIIKGQNYNFCVVVDEAEFYIEAIHLTSMKFSFINNLNAILSNFNISIDDKKVSESQWVISKEQGRLFFKEAIKSLLDKTYRDYIEKRLDDDRRYSEWENRKNT